MTARRTSRQGGAQNSNGNLELKNTVLALRRQMEQMASEKRQAARKEIADLNAEIGQLQRTILALREELENRDSLHAEEVQRLSRQARDEQKQLQDMIVVLRDRLQDRDG